MAVHWDCSECALHHSALAKATESGEFDHTVQEWDEYTDLREALIWALVAVRFPDKSGWKITEKNWEEVYLRLNILERVRGCYRVYSVPDEDDPTKASRFKKREVFFSPEEIHSMIGMSVNAGNLSTTKFKNLIYKMLRDDAESSLNRYKKEQQNETSSEG